jgi:hypothetical protein
MTRLIIGRDLDALAIFAAVALHAASGRDTESPRVTPDAAAPARNPDREARVEGHLTKAEERRLRKNAKRAADAEKSRAGGRHARRQDDAPPA